MTSLLITALCIGFCLGFCLGAIYTYVVYQIVERKHKQDKP